MELKTITYRNFFGFTKSKKVSDTTFRRLAFLGKAFAMDPDLSVKEHRDLFVGVAYELPLPFSQIELVALRAAIEQSNEKA